MRESLLDRTRRLCWWKAFLEIGDFIEIQQLTENVWIPGCKVLQYAVEEHLALELDEQQGTEQRPFAGVLWSRFESCIWQVDQGCSCMVSIEVLVSKMWMGIWQSRKKTVFQRCGWLSDISRFMVKKSWPFAVLTVGSLPLWSLRNAAAQISVWQGSNNPIRRSGRSHIGRLRIGGFACSMGSNSFWAGRAGGCSALVA